MKPNREEIIEKITEFILKNRYVLLILIVGVVLLSLPTTKNKTNETQPESTDSGTFSVSEYESRLSALLSRIDGAGEVTVLLSVAGSEERVIASDTRLSESESETDGRAQSEREEETTAVKISEGSGTNDVVTLKYIYPEFTGAVVLAEGAGSSRVRLDITEAVEAATGLSADRIKVIKMK